VSLAPTDAQALAPTGTLRFGLVKAPLAGVFFVSIDAEGRPDGTTALLAANLARHAGLPLEPVVFPNSGECMEALVAGRIDAGFMPVDDYRKERVSFGPGYFDLESTYMVSAASGIATLAEVDHPGVRVVGIAGTTTIRAATRTLSHTVPAPVRSAEEAFALLRDGKADAVALSRDSLEQALPDMPGTRITPGGFQHMPVGVAVPRGNTAGLAVVTAWLEGAKADGTVGRMLGKAHAGTRPPTQLTGNDVQPQS